MQLCQYEKIREPQGGKLVRTGGQIAANEVMEVYLESCENGVRNGVQSFRIEQVNEFPAPNCHGYLERGHVTVGKFGWFSPGSAEETWGQEISGSMVERQEARWRVKEKASRRAPNSRTRLVMWSLDAPMKTA